MQHKKFLNPKDSLALAFQMYGKIWEPLLTEFIKKEIKKGEVVLDLGANIGYYTLILAELVGENGKVYAFEPEPQNFVLLEKNVKANDYRNIILIQKAVSNKSGKIKLYLSEYRDPTISFNSSYGHKSIEIETIRLDDYFKEYTRKINFIKMDIEGAEGRALQGASLFLQKNKNVKIVTEFNPMLLKGCGTEPREYLDSLLDLGFKLYNINEQKKKIEPADTTELLKSYTPKKKNATNLLCLREK